MLFFKSLLFMNVGGILHLNFSIQDFRQYSNRGFFSPLILWRSILRLIRLIGLVFSTGFFSKDIILEKLWFSFGRQILVFLLILRVRFTFFYSFTIFRVIFNITRRTLLLIGQRISLNLSLWVSSLFSIFVGRIFWWNYISRRVFWVVGVKIKLGFLFLLFLLSLNFLVKTKRLKIKFYLFYIGMLNLSANYSRKFLLFLIFTKRLFEKSWLERLERNFIYQRIRKRVVNFWGRSKFLWWFSILGVTAVLLFLLPK